MTTQLYDQFYKRLKLRSFIDQSGIKQELKLPLCTKIDDISITNSTSISKYQYSYGKYKSSFTKRINRRSPVTIEGLVADDIVVRSHIENVIEPSDYKSLDYYLYALNHLDTKIIYTFDGLTGLMNVEEVNIESYGSVRKFSIKGFRSC